MTDYVKTTDFAAKDNLVSGNPLKIIRGAEHDTEYNNIASAIASKANTDNPTFTGQANFLNLTVFGTFTATVDGGSY